MLLDMRQQIFVVDVAHQHQVHLLGNGGFFDPGLEFRQIVQGQAAAVKG